MELPRGSDPSYCYSGDYFYSAKRNDSMMFALELSFKAFDNIKVPLVMAASATFMLAHLIP